MMISVMSHKAHVFLGLGECMVELAPMPDGLLHQGFAGDVFNTLWYAAHLLGPDWRVRFHTALGRDALSDELALFAADAGVDCSAALRLKGAVPGLYMIRLSQGERSFLYWRGQSAARQMMNEPAHVAHQIDAADVVYLSGITLAILPPEGRTVLIALMAKARTKGRFVAFDPNIRPALWEDMDTACSVITKAAAASSLVLPSFDDEASGFGDRTPTETVARYMAAGARMVVVKNGAGAVVTNTSDSVEAYDTPPLSGPIIDSTAAGDAFNAAYLASYIMTLDPARAVRAGQRLAAHVVQGRGALVAPIAPTQKDTTNE